MVFLTLLFTVFGIINENNRGEILTAGIMIYVFMGSFAGYYSARIYKMFNVIFYWLRDSFILWLHYY